MPFPMLLSITSPFPIPLSTNLNFNGGNVALFTATQRAKIIRFLGYSNQDMLGSQGQSVTVLRDRLDATYTPEFITEVQTVLTGIETVNQQTLESLTKSRIIQADVIKFSYTTQAQMLQQQGTSFVAELASLLGVDVLFNKFSGTSQISYRSY